MVTVLQTDGATPLYIASANGHVECVRALLDRGAEINQATTVGCQCASSMAPGCGICVRGMRGSLAACVCVWSGALGCDEFEAFRSEVGIGRRVLVVGL